MILVKYKTESRSRPRPGVLQDNKIIDVEAQLPGQKPQFGTLLEEATTGGLTSLSRDFDDEVTVQRDSAELLAPVDTNGRVFCFGAVYTGHMEDSGLSLDFDPNQWVVPDTAVIGPEDSIVLPERVADDVAPAAELCVVIGRAGKYIDPMDSREHVAGYTISNDVTARTEWPGPMGYKLMDTFSPIGPHVRTTDEIRDPTDLTIEMRLDDDVICRGSTGGMRFSINFLVSYLSTIVELRPGDVISMGDPGGVQHPLSPQSDVEIEVEDVGTLQNSVRLEDAD